MSELKTQPETNHLINGSKKLWNDAIRMVKGENANQLVEQFTAEMTLVAEGLCEDQNKLRGEVNGMLNEEDRRIQRLDTRVDRLETSLDSQQEENDLIVTELRQRIAALEKQNARDAKNIKEKKDKRENIVKDITKLIVVAALAVIAVALVLKLI